MNTVTINKGDICKSIAGYYRGKIEIKRGEVFTFDRLEKKNNSVILKDSNGEEIELSDNIFKIVFLDIGQVAKFDDLDIKKTIEKLFDDTLKRRINWSFISTHGIGVDTFKCIYKINRSKNLICYLEYGSLNNSSLRIILEFNKNLQKKISYIKNSKYLDLLYISVINSINERSSKYMIDKIRKSMVDYLLKDIDKLKGSIRDTREDEYLYSKILFLRKDIVENYDMLHFFNLKEEIDDVSKKIK
ncbi:MAG: hypothetical protein KC550_07185 [Nanoarchaeota archaeon]|nr:hypothetical protein [Nanoarchaeota archaeon]